MGSGMVVLSRKSSAASPSYWTRVTTRVTASQAMFPLAELWKCSTSLAVIPFRCLCLASVNRCFEGSLLLLQKRRCRSRGLILEDEVENLGAQAQIL
jgi:hypothetical protein